MITLAIDSTMNGCGVCIRESSDGASIHDVREISRGQAEHLMPMIEKALKQANKTYQDLGLVAVTQGPGAFTGMRIGIATAKSLSLALDIPVIGVCTLGAIACTAIEQNKITENDNLCILLETKRKDFYIQYRKNGVWSEKKTATLKDVTEIIKDHEVWYVAGDAYSRFQSEYKTLNPQVSLKNVTDIKTIMPHPSIVAKIGTNTYKAIKDTGEAFPKITPVYLRPPDIGTPKAKMRKIAKK